MSNKEKISTLVLMIENIELQEECNNDIIQLENLYKLKEKIPNDNSVKHLTLSYLSKQITDNKDLLHNLLKAYHNYCNLVV